jgi:hypothetical protein
LTNLKRHTFGLHSIQEALRVQHPGVQEVTMPRKKLILMLITAVFVAAVTSAAFTLYLPNWLVSDSPVGAQDRSNELVVAADPTAK